MTGFLNKITSIAASLTEKPSDKEANKNAKRGPIMIPHNLPDPIRVLRIEVHRALDHQLAAQANDLMDKLVEIAYGFPASEEYHHATYTGLIEHSLSVAVKALAKVRAVGQYQLRIRRFHTLLAALGHDLGKTSEWVVETRGFDWCPILDTMGRHTGPWSLSAKRDGIWHKNSPFTSVLMINRLLDEKYYRSDLYNPTELNYALEAIALHHMPPLGSTNPYLEALLAADRDDVVESVSENSAPSPAPDQNANPDPQVATASTESTSPESPAVVPSSSPETQTPGEISADDKVRVINALMGYLEQKADIYYVGSLDGNLALVEPFNPKQTGNRKPISQFTRNAGFASDGDFLSALGSSLILDKDTDFTITGREKKNRRLVVIDMKGLEPGEGINSLPKASAYLKNTIQLLEPIHNEGETTDDSDQSQEDGYEDDTPDY